MELKDKQAQLTVLMLQAESLQNQILQLKQEVIREMNIPRAAQKDIEVQKKK